MENILFRCCWCDKYFVVAYPDFNCRIVRCGVFKETYVQIPQHLSEEECDRLVENQLIIGCARPLRIVGEPPSAVVEKCDYI